MGRAVARLRRTCPRRRGRGDREQLVEFLADECPGWWLPDRVEFIDEIPKTSTNKLDKKVLRDQFADLDIETDREASDTSDA